MHFCISYTCIISNPSCSAEILNKNLNFWWKNKTKHLQYAERLVTSLESLKCSLQGHFDEVKLQILELSQSRRFDGLLVKSKPLNLIVRPLNFLLLCDIYLSSINTSGVEEEDDILSVSFRIHLCPFYSRNSQTRVSFIALVTPLANYKERKRSSFAKPIYKITSVSESRLLESIYSP